MLLCHSVKYRELFAWSRCISTLLKINRYKDTFLMCMLLPNINL